MSRQPKSLIGRLGGEHVVLGLLAVAVGGLAGAGAIAFRYAVEGVQWLGFGPGPLADVARALPAWQVVAVPTLGGALIGVLCACVFKGSQPQGVADVIEANALRDGRIGARDGLGAAGINALAIGVGGSVGREGPIVHVGAALAAVVATRVGLGPGASRTLLGCGVAAAVAAAFNAPIAGVFFALEVVIGHYALTAFSPVVIASVMGTIVSRLHYGDAVAFTLPPQTIVSFFEFPAFVLLGLVCGGVAIVLLRSIALVDTLFERLEVRLWLRPMLAGLATGLIALTVPEVLGVGYETTDRALNDRFALALVVTIALAKALATALCLGARFGGGIFSPALVIGALTGVAFDEVAEQFFPSLSSDAALYGILGMGAVAAAVLGAPISTIIMIFELTHDYDVTFALMVSVAVATLFTMQVYGHSFFTWQLARRRLDLRHALELGLLRDRRVETLLVRKHHEVAATATLQELQQRFLERPSPVFVCDTDGRLQGEVTVEQLARATFASREPPPTAGDLARRPLVVLYAEEPLDAAWHRAHRYGGAYLAVVRSRTDRRLVGTVRHRDLANAYGQALLKARAIERGEG